MRRQICSLALSTFFGLGVAMAAPQAQDPSAAPQTNQEHRDGGNHRPDPNRQVQVLSKRLNLTDAQRDQILPILTNRQQQIEGVFSDSSLSPSDRHAKMRAIREDSDRQIRAVLTDAQKQTYDQMQQHMREREQQRRENQSSGGGQGSL